MHPSIVYAHAHIPGCPLQPYDRGLASASRLPARSARAAAISSCNVCAALSFVYADETLNTSAFLFFAFVTLRCLVLL